MRHSGTALALTRVTSQAQPPSAGFAARQIATTFHRLVPAAEESFLSVFDWAEPVTPESGERAVTWRRLAFVMQRQQKQQWCWSATATSVALFRDPGSPWTQCEVARQTLGVADCCSDGMPAACDQPYHLDAALATVNCFVRIEESAWTTTQLAEELAAGRALPIRVGWAGGGGHFLALIGVTESGPTYVAVADPWFGSSEVAIAAFSGAYQGSGTWTHSYQTG